jgi:hypothetical protein
LTDESLKQSVAELLCALDFDTEAASHLIHAVAEVHRRIRRNNGGVEIVQFSMSGAAGQRLVSHSPVILVEKAVLRRKAG